jgi:hypothetical protein
MPRVFVTLLAIFLQATREHTSGKAAPAKGGSPASISYMITPSD